jgi:hypothetical protein
VKHLRLPDGYGIAIFLGELPHVFAHDADLSEMQDAVVFVFTMNRAFVARLAIPRRQVDSLDGEVFDAPSPTAAAIPARGRPPRRPTGHRSRQPWSSSLLVPLDHRPYIV